MNESPEALKTLAAELVDRVKAHGATAADVLVAEGDSVSVQVRLSAVECLSQAREKRLGIRAFFGKRSASASTSDFSETSLTQLVADTCALAKAVAEDETSGLPEQAALATDVPDLDLYDPTTMPVEEAIQVAQRAERAAMDADPRMTNSEGSRVWFGLWRGGVGEYAWVSGVPSEFPVFPVRGARGRRL